MSKIRQWVPRDENDEMIENVNGGFVLYADYKQIVDRVCRWPVTALIEGRAQNGGKASCGFIITTQDRAAGGRFCNHCGGEVEVV